MNLLAGAQTGVMQKGAPWLMSLCPCRAVDVVCGCLLLLTGDNPQKAHVRKAWSQLVVLLRAVEIPQLSR